MSQPTASINDKLIDSLAQIILSLTDEERQLLGQKIQYSAALPKGEIQRQQAALQRDIMLGIEQLKNGNYTEYDDSSLPSLLENIKIRGKQQLKQELVE
jgi:hypothetical protein